MSTKALKSQLLAAVAMVLVASVALGSSTFAWFAANRTVTATDMKVTAQSEGSLVITSGTVPGKTTTSTTVSVASADGQATALFPTTHDSGADYTKGLKFVQNTSDVDMTTGVASKDKTLTYTAVTESENYYKDYVVYLAANGAALKNQDIEVKITTAKETEDNKLLMNATSIDFYWVADQNTTVDSETATKTFAGTLNLAGLDSTRTDGTEKIVLDLKTNTAIPKAGDNCIPVIMRVYVDGALVESEGKTYVRSSEVADIHDLTLNVQFDATPNSGT